MSISVNSWIPLFLPKRMQHAALVGKTKRITPPKLFFINDNVDNFRPDQLPGATRGFLEDELY